MRFWKYLLVKSNIRYLARSFALSLSLFLSLPLFSGLVSASALLLSQNIKGSSPTCWPLWSMFCVSLCVFALVSVCEGHIRAGTRLHMCLCFSVCLRLLLGRTWTYVYISSQSEDIVYACVSNCVRACIDGSVALGLPRCDRAGARRVSGSWANGFMVMVPISWGERQRPRLWLINQ